MIRVILMKVGVSVVGLGAVLFLTKAWHHDTGMKSIAAKRAATRTADVR